MKAQEFRTLIEQLEDLSQVQREALLEALSAKGSDEEVIALYRDTVRSGAVLWSLRRG